MEIKIVENPAAEPKILTPAELARGQKCVLVDVPKQTTLIIDGDKKVTFDKGFHQVPTAVSSALFAAGADIVRGDGTCLPRPAPKPINLRNPSPFQGTKRFSI